MNNAWQWLGTQHAARCISIAMMIFLAIAELGRTGSYLKATNIILMASVFWIFGFRSNGAQQ